MASHHPWRGFIGCQQGQRKQDFGATTWQSGILPAGNNISTGSVASDAISIIGDKEGDRVGTFTFALPNGNYVVSSPEWSSPTTQKVGAVTWANGTIATNMVVSASNSLVGSKAFDYIGSNNLSPGIYKDGIVALPNSNYLVRSNNWDNASLQDAGAVTFCSNTGSTTGVITSTNSLVGNRANQNVGDIVVILSNGNYAVGTSKYIDETLINDFRSGAVTWGSGTTGVMGNITPTNSITGPYVPSLFGNPPSFSETGSDVVALSNGNYAVISKLNNGNGTFGAVTLCKGDGSTLGKVSVANSLTASMGQQNIGSKLEALSNGSYLVHSSNLSNNGSNAGAVTLMNGTLAASGLVTDCNSILGEASFGIVEGDKNIVYNYAKDYLLAGSKIYNKVYIYEGPTAVTLANEFQEKTENILGSQPFSTLNNCKLIASIAPNGANPIIGEVTSKVWIELDQPTTFVKRLYEITPKTNPNAASAKITLYYTQAEFNDYNAINELKLPTGPMDAVGIGNLILDKISGTSSDNTGLPSSYTGSTTIINPADSDIIWNSQQNRWEVSFNTVGFSGFFAKAGITTTLPLNWLSVKVKLNNNKAHIAWEVDETNIANYEIQKLSANNEWSTIGQTASKGNGKNAYFFTENENINSISYYKIKQNSQGGNNSFSKIVQLNAKEYIDVQVSPNPVSNLLTIKMNKIIGKNNSVILLSTNGKIIKSLQIKDNISTIDMAELPNAIYFLKIQNDKNIIQKKIFKNN